MKLRRLPLRVATGAYILNSGLSKWNADEERASQLHSFAANAYPQVKQLRPEQFARAGGQAHCPDATPIEKFHTVAKERAKRCGQHGAHGEALSANTLPQEFLAVAMKRAQRGGWPRTSWRPSGMSCN